MFELADFYARCPSQRELRLLVGLIKGSFACLVNV